jgi:hypothetical protein
MRPVRSTSISTQAQYDAGSDALSATPAGLCSGRVASSDERFHCSRPFWPPIRRSRLPSFASFIARNVTCEAGSSVVCRT